MNSHTLLGIIKIDVTPLDKQFLIFLQCQSYTYHDAGFELQMCSPERQTYVQAKINHKCS